MQIDQSNVFEFLVAIGLGGLLREVVTWFMGRGQRRETVETSLRNELTDRYDEANQEIHALHGEVEKLWDARQEDRLYIDELETFISQLITIMTEHRVGPIPARPSRRRRTESHV